MEQCSSDDSLKKNLIEYYPKNFHDKSGSIKLNNDFFVD
jgi:hypothetical protein